MTILGPFLLIFFADYMYIFHKNLVQTVILKCLTCQNLIWIKGYNIRHKKVISFFFCNFVKKMPENLQLKNGHFMTLSSHFFANHIKIFQKTEIQTVILRSLVGLKLNWIKSYGIILVQINFFHA